MEDHLRIRAWNGKKMLYFCLISKKWFYREDGKAITCMRQPSTKSLKIMTCSGLRAKNGQLGYTGDNLYTDGELVGPIVFFDGSFCVDMGSTTNPPSPLKQDRMNRLEIIGNIHETLKPKA